MKRILADGGPYTLEGMIEDDADLDGVFVLTEDDGTKLKVNGWMFIIEFMEG